MIKTLSRIFLAFGLIPAVVLALLITVAFSIELEEVLHEQAEQKLILQRENKKAEIENYLNTIISQIKSLSHSSMTINASQDFIASFYDDSIDVDRVTTQKSRLEAYYSNDFSSKFAELNGEGVDGKKLVSDLPNRAIFFQDAYISDNPHPLGSKEELVSSKQSIEYDAVHAKYHSPFRTFLREFGYYDIFIADINTGDIVYSVFKELDYATSLKTGPYANSPIGEVFAKGAAINDPNRVAVVDFSPYLPSYNTPAAFVSMPIFDGQKKIAVLIFQFPIGRINDIMTYKQNWKNVGLGDSGETYLVGSDKLMRSMGRFIVDDKANYLAALKTTTLSPSVIAEIAAKDTTVGLQPVDTPAVNEALAGNSGYDVVLDYRNVSVLSAYAPVEVPGFNWAILSEIDEAEGYQATQAAIVRAIITGIIGLVLIASITTYIALRYAKKFAAPFRYILGSLEFIAKDIKEGHVDLTQPLQPPGNSSIANRMSQGINTVLGTFSDVLREFSKVTDAISDSSAYVAELSVSSRDNMKKQNAETNHVIEAIKELSASSERVSNSASEGAAAATVADNDTREGAKTVNAAVERIQELATNLTQTSVVIDSLERDSENIGTVLAVIQTIAEQTNLLALNAAIEAARAGEMGRGFAVVADEVRTLASKTQTSTEEIRKIIEQLQSSSKQAVEAMNTGCSQAGDSLEKALSAGNALDNIKTKVAEIDKMNDVMEEAAKEQFGVTNDVSSHIYTISQLSEETSLKIENSSAAAETLLEQARNLKTLSDQFKV